MNKKIEQEKDKDKHVFINSSGKSFAIQGLPPLIVPMIAGDLPKPVKPTYTIVTAAGDEEIHDHDETTLQTEEDKKAWEDYQNAMKVLEGELSNRMLTCVLVDGVDIDDEIDLKRWEKRQSLMGISVPEDPDEKLLQYKKSMVIRSSDDIVNLISAVLAITGIGREALDKARDSFQDKLEPES
jgi:hypothetical protein